MKNRKQRNLNNNNDKLSHAWPQDTQQKCIQTLDAKPLMQNPLPFFPAQRPSFAITSISRLGQQTNKSGKKRQPYHPYKEQQEFSP